MRRKQPVLNKIVRRRLLWRAQLALRFRPTDPWVLRPLRWLAGQRRCERCRGWFWQWKLIERPRFRTTMTAESMPFTTKVVEPPEKCCASCDDLAAIDEAVDRALQRNLQERPYVSAIHGSD